jgi:hypothetical protein
VIRRIHNKLRPKQGFAHFFHLGIVALLPLLVFVFVRLELFSVALAVILLSKWRIFAVRPRHWLAHIRTNAVDIIFSLSILAFMTSTTAMSWQIIWVVIYEIWVLYIKPGSSPLFVSIQSLVAQLAGLTALFVAFETVPLSIYIISAALILYFSARHFFASFEESHYHIYSWVWTLFGACLIWVLGHWLLFYGPVAQPAIILSVIGYGLAALYYLSETDKLSKLVRRQVVFVMVTVVVVLLVLSDWGSRTI